MTNPRLVRIAYELLSLGVSHARCEQLLRDHPPEEIERQLKWLPFRKARRPEALLIRAITYNYSAPKEAFYADDATHDSGTEDPLVQGSQPPL